MGFALIRKCKLEKEIASGEKYSRICWKVIMSHAKQT
jgi:hypothetical protein